jgi:inorganic triphosphatase YgiF
MSVEERELKLTPTDPSLFDRLERLQTLGPFDVVGRRTERQRNSFFDTGNRALQRARIGFRRRDVQGQSMATWTIKAEGTVVRGVLTRPEVELQLGADMPPALAIGVLRDAARQQGAEAVAELVDDALSSGPLPLAQPYLEMQTERRILDLLADAEGWKAELALDDVRILGHLSYAELEIEVELKRGDDAALEAARLAIEAEGGVTDAVGTKLSRALEHLGQCACRSSDQPR